MCGIAGLYLPWNAPVRDIDLDAMLAVMAHRGPDGASRYVSDDRRYQTGFARLAIIDLETGNQPIVEKAGGHVLSGNGEIYNYLELRAAHADYPYQTKGDMEAALPLYSAFGDGFVDHINGMFGLALYERQRHRLLLVRDRLGIKPLYWARTESGGIVFASEIKALFASTLIERGVNPEAAPDYIAHGYVPAPATLFKGVNKLPPGHMLIAEANGRIEVRRYWRPRPSDTRPADMDGAAQSLTGLLKNSIHMQLRSDVPVGALLSGGIDSGLMVALAAEQSSRPLDTFTVRFDGATVDETPLARMVAERYGTNHTELTVGSGDVAAWLPSLVWHCEEPLFDPSLLPNHLVEKSLSRSVKVVLNGTGGDELFAGYGRYFRLPVEKNYLLLPKWARKGIVEPLIGAISPMTAWRLRRAAKFDGDPGGYLHDHTTQFPPPLRRLIGNTGAQSTAAQAIHFDGAFSDAQSAALAADIATYLPEDILLLLDRTTMASSVEGRVPFLDHRLVEAALAVPAAIRTPGGRQKALERAMASPYLPNEILDAPKQGFASPVSSWFKDSTLTRQARRILTRPGALDRGWWTEAGIDALCSDPAHHGFRIYSLLVLELSIIIHVENAPLSKPPTEGLEAYADAV